MLKSVDVGVDDGVIGVGDGVWLRLFSRFTLLCGLNLQEKGTASVCLSV